MRTSEPGESRNWLLTITVSPVWIPFVIWTPSASRCPTTTGVTCAFPCWSRNTEYPWEEGIRLWLGTCRASLVVCRAMAKCALWPATNFQNYKSASTTLFNPNQQYGYSMGDNGYLSSSMLLGSTPCCFTLFYSHNLHISCNFIARSASAFFCLSLK